MVNYITLEEFKYLGGNPDVTQGELLTMLLQFKSSIHPNHWMLTEFFNENGSYPLEVKLAIKEFVNYRFENNKSLTSPPLGGMTIGSTNIDYVNNPKYYGDAKFMQSPTVREILKSTNLLSPRGYIGPNKGLKLLGTPFIMPEQPAPEPELPNEQPVKLEPRVDLPFEYKNTNVFDVRDLIDKTPNVNITIYKQVLAKDGAIVLDYYNLEPLGSLQGYYRGTVMDDDKRAIVIIPPVFESGDKVELKRDYSISLDLGGQQKTYKVDGYDEHVGNNSEVHHYLVYLT